MARRSIAFMQDMKDSLLENQPFIVHNLSNVPDIMDYLVAGKVFPDAEDIMSDPRRKEQVRNLLTRLVKRKANDYWTFICCLFQDRIGQGHIAEKILETYEQKGGTIPADISRLRQDYHDHVGHDDHARMQALPDPGRHQRRGLDVVQAPPGQFLLPASAATGQQRDGQRTETGNFLAFESASQLHGMPVQQRQPHGMEVDDGDGGRQAVGGLQPPVAEGGSDGESPYSRQRRTDQDGVYKMDSNPRGLALIIDNEYFETLSRRNGTSDDRELLEDMLNTLGVEVTLKRDLTAKEMRRALADFSQHPRMADVGSSIVAILSHGSAGGVIYGVDGRCGPGEGTFIRTTEMYNLFTSVSCPCLHQKPKLFILQCCRGMLEDTATGVRPIDLRRDAGLESPQRESRFLDMASVYSTLEGMVAYRQHFIQHLARVFRENAATLSFNGMVRKVIDAVGTDPVAEELFVTAERSDSLRKKWYFNPPPSV